MLDGFPAGNTNLIVRFMDSPETRSESLQTYSLSWPQSRTAAAKIHQLMDERGINQTELGKRIGLPQGRVSVLLNTTLPKPGKKRLRLNGIHLAKIAKALGLQDESEILPPNAKHLLPIRNGGVQPKSTFRCAELEEYLHLNSDRILLHEAEKLSEAVSGLREDKKFKLRAKLFEALLIAIRANTDPDPDAH